LLRRLLDFRHFFDKADVDAKQANGEGTSFVSFGYRPMSEFPLLISTLRRPESAAYVLPV
jgi:hypothetical protein